MSARVTSDFWVSAYLRRVMTEGAFAALRQRGAAEAGAIFVKLDLLDGRDGKLVWRGSAEQVLRASAQSPAQREAAIRNTVAQVLAHYPPH